MIILHLQWRSCCSESDPKKNFCVASAVVLSKPFENKMAEIYRCAVGPQLHRSFTKNSRQVSVEWTLFYLENSILPFGFRDSLAYAY